MITQLISVLNSVLMEHFLRACQPNCLMARNCAWNNVEAVVLIVRENQCDNVKTTVKQHKNRGVCVAHEFSLSIQHIGAYLLTGMFNFSAIA